LNHCSIAKQAKEMKTRIHHDSERYDETFRVGVEIEEFIVYLDKSIQKVWRNNNSEVIPVFLGGNPSPLIFKDGLITDKPRYNQLARWQNKIPDVEIDGQKLKALHVATAIQGFHLHLQAQNPVHKHKCSIIF
jgi:hypothetical protein